MYIHGMPRHAMTADEERTKNETSMLHVRCFQYRTFDGVFDQLGIKCVERLWCAFFAVGRGCICWCFELLFERFSCFWSYSPRLVMDAFCVPFVQSIPPPIPPEFIKRKVSCRGWVLGRFHRRFQSVLSCSSWGGFKPSPPRVRGS